MIMLSLPNNQKQLLLHSCCAPCSGGIIESMIESGINPTVFFYNPNIYPRQEYETRKAAIKSFSQKKGIPFIDDDYNSDDWLKRVEGLEDEPERGRRCTVCFSMRLERAALYAYENGFKVFTSSLSISLRKNREQVLECGIRAATRYPELTFWTYNWRQNGGVERSNVVAKREGFYRQKYCGCRYSFKGINTQQSVIHSRESDN